MHATHYPLSPAVALAVAAHALAPWFEAGRIVVQPDDCDEAELSACLRDLDAFFDALRADGEEGGAA